MLTSDFDYALPPELIAQTPAPARDSSRLLHLDRASARLTHCRFPDIVSFFGTGDVIILNESRVIPARLNAFRVDAPGEIEVLLLEETEPWVWWVMARPGRRLRVGDSLGFRRPDGANSPLTANVLAINAEGGRLLRFNATGDWRTILAGVGSLPLPPYIRRPGGLSAEDGDRYQTVYARVEGSVAAPTAGLHFTGGVLAALKAKGVTVANVVLHVGAGTFAPVKSDKVEDHPIHEERYEIPAETADAVLAARRSGRKVVAVGTTSLRTLETQARRHGGHVPPGEGRTRLFLKPGDNFAAVDALITNFHLPRSTLLMLVSAFAAPGRHPEGRDLILRAYAEAIRERYRFFSYGDAMLIT